MKLIFIYGPPAAGKLTIAEKVSANTGIPLFHNHLSRDIVKDIYGDRIEEHYDLVRQIRVDVLEYCAKNNTDLIFTYVYGGSFDDKNVKDLVRTVEPHGGKVEFVELTADRTDLIRRVDNESRKKFKKLTDKQILADLTEDMSRFTIPFVKSLKINTSRSNADEAAKLIINELGLE